MSGSDERTGSMSDDTLDRLLSTEPGRADDQGEDEG